jgi:hypothetical protein
MTMLLIPREVERECIFKETSLKSYILKQTTGKKHYLSRERNLVCIEPTYFFFNFLTIRKILAREWTLKFTFSEQPFTLCSILPYNVPFTPGHPASAAFLWIQVHFLPKI